MKKIWLFIGSLLFNQQQISQSTFGLITQKSSEKFKRYRVRAVLKIDKSTNFHIDHLHKQSDCSQPIHIDTHERNSWHFAMPTRYKLIWVNKSITYGLQYHRKFEKENDIDNVLLLNQNITMNTTQLPMPAVVKLLYHFQTAKFIISNRYPYLHDFQMISYILFERENEWINK